MLKKGQIWRSDKLNNTILILCADYEKDYLVCYYTKSSSIEVGTKHIKDIEISLEKTMSDFWKLISE